MEIVFHLGAHCTDEDRLLRGLLKGRAALLERGVVVPAPGRYRNLLRQATMPLKGAAASPELAEALVDTIADGDAVNRLVFSHDSFLCLASRVAGPQGIYASAGTKAAAYANLFPEADVTFMLALRNPATLIPALVAHAEGAGYDAVMNGCDPRRISWIPVVAALREAVPQARLILWCNEDSPLIWPELLRHAAGLPFDAPVPAQADLAASLLTPGGAYRLEAFLARHPPRSVAGTRHAFRAFLERFAAPGALEMHIALPGWDEALVADLTAAYDRDCEVIADIEGVEMILP